MAHFYGTMSGGSSRAYTKRGHKTNGIQATVEGYNSGVEVACFYDAGLSRDIFVVRITEGTNGPSNYKTVGKVIEGQGWEPVGMVDMLLDYIKSNALLPEVEVALLAKISERNHVAHTTVVPEDTSRFRR